LVLASVTKPQRNAKIKASCVTYIWRALPVVLSNYNNILSGGKEIPLRTVHLFDRVTPLYSRLFTVTEKKLFSPPKISL
jgi:hypothetical protein